jgi:capsular exopolysaccharide synthesis family protein
MSKFFKALEQAERDRLLRQRHRETDIWEPEPAATSSPEAGPVAPARTAETDNETSPVLAGRGPAGAPTLGAQPSVFRRPLSSPVPLDGDEPDRGAGVDDRLVSLLDPSTFEAEQYRALRHAVEQAHRRAGLSVVAISSPAVGDGKTTTAINLAGALAQAPEVRVLLVDADLRRPSIASRLGLVGPAGPTLADLVLDPLLSLDDAARSRPPFNLSVIPAGSKSPNSYELFKAPRLGEILAEARSRFDYVILDTAPLVHVLDSRVIGRWVDGYLIVVGCHQTSRKLLAEALSVMEPEKVVGLVFNGDERPLSDSRYYHYAYAPPPSGQKTGRLTRVLRARSRRRRRP